MNSRWTRFIIVVLSLFVITIFIGQAFFAGGDYYPTETAYRYNIDEEISFRGVYMRDESLIYNSGSGVLNYVCENGSKVGKSSVIARRYRNETDVVYRREIENIQSQIDVLTSAEKLVGTDNSQLDAISAQINESHAAVVSSIMSGDYDTANSRRDDLLEAMCKREISLKSLYGYTERKQELNNEISRLTNMLHGEVQDITADGAGYFVSEVDGYESEVSFSDTEKMTEEYINSVIAAPKKKSTQNVIGKLIDDYHWRVAAVIDNERMFGIYEGSTVTLRVGAGTQLLKAEVVYAKPCSTGKSVYIFECDNLNSSVVSGRTAMFKVVVNSYGGLRVSRKALRYNDEGAQGVYVIQGQSLAFKYVDVVYWGKDYVISSGEIKEDHLMMYDQVVTEGKDLYDGKVIK